MLRVAIFGGDENLDCILFIEGIIAVVVGGYDLLVHGYPFDVEVGIVMAECGNSCGIGLIVVGGEGHELL